MTYSSTKTPFTQESDTSISPTGMRAVVADDNEALAQTTGWMLELLGYEVQLAADGLQALAISRAFQPDVVLIDIGLPELSGYDVCRQLRADPAFAHSLIIAHSGWSQPEHLQRSQAAGFDYHLVKPVDMEGLEKLLIALRKTPSDTAH